MRSDWSVQMQAQYDEICQLLRSIDSAAEFYSIMKGLNSGSYDIDLVRLAREHLQVFNAAQY